MKDARYIMIGGFLGAGKSTSIGRLARRLTDRGVKVGLITNDQGANLVDTSFLRAQGFPVEEIAGGCFCCRFDSLRSAADNLSASSRPEVFVGEPVGSCTDLVATVSYPLRRIYGDSFQIAPLSVVVDPQRCLRVLGLEDGRRFSKNVTYVYRKQLEEARFIVINKIDSIEPERIKALRSGLEKAFPRAEVFEVSAREDKGLDAWFERVMVDEIEAGWELEIDYDTYADGEARLGWLNATLAVDSTEAFDANKFVRKLASDVQKRIVDKDGEIAHLKLTLSPAPDDDSALAGEIAVANLTHGDEKPESSHEISELVRRGQIVINIRAEIAPEELDAALRAGVEGTNAEGSVSLGLDHVECFRPGRPEPTHRMTADSD